MSVGIAVNLSLAEQAVLVCLVRKHVIMDEGERMDVPIFQ
jgi:hypothetical protein